ncbi:MAG: hypothetical protein ACR2QE_14785 [Acidimicrobiales bacterium]
MTSRRSILIAALFGMGAIVLSLSDRAPSVWKQVSSGLEEVWHRVEVAFAIDLDRQTIPWTADEIGHLVLWGGGMVLLGLALRHRYRADRIAATLFVSSLLLEVLQALVTARRSLSLLDAAANGLGIMVGLTLVVAIELIWPLPSPAHPADG